MWAFNDPPPSAPDTPESLTIWIRAQMVRPERVCPVCGRTVVVAYKADGLTVILNQVFDVLTMDVDRHGRIEQVAESALHTVTCRDK